MAPPPLPKHIELAGILLIVGAGLGFIVSVEKRMPAASSPSARSTASYNPSKICPDTYSQALDFSQSKDNHFTITLPEGCFGNWVRVPKWWTEWHADAATNPSDYWVYFWFAGDGAPQGAYYANDRRPVNASINQSFRLQGHGTIVFYTNQATRPQAAGNSEANYPPPLPEKPAIDPVAAGDFKFEVKLCTKNGARIRCYGTITNTAREPERLFIRNSDSYVIDNHGSQSSFGNNNVSMTVGDGTHKPLLPDVPVEFSFTADDPGQDITHLTIALALAPGQFPSPFDRNLPLAVLKNIPLVEK